MQTATASDARDRLLKALASLRALLTDSPPRQFEYSIAAHVNLDTRPEQAAIGEVMHLTAPDTTARMVVGKIKGGPELDKYPEGLGTATHIKMLRQFVWELRRLTELPAPPPDIRRLDEFIRDFGGGPTPADSGRWSSGKTRKQWSKVFCVSVATFDRRRKDGSITWRPFGKLIQVAVSSLPKDEAK